MFSIYWFLLIFVSYELEGRTTAARSEADVDCTVGEWSQWTVCSASCMPGGEQRRIRGILTPPMGGGNPCPVLREQRACNVGVSCDAPLLSAKDLSDLGSTDITAQPTPPTAGTPCTNQPDGHYPIGFCSKEYYSCVAGMYIPQTCPGALVYDSVTNRCDLASNTEGCTGTSKRTTTTTTEQTTTSVPLFDCSSRNNGFYANPFANNSCDQMYYACTNHLTAVQWCPAGLYFDEDNQSCQLYAYIPNCSGRQRTTTMTTSSQPEILAETVTTEAVDDKMIDCGGLPSGNYADPYGTPPFCSTAYYTCANGVAMRRICQRALYYDRKRNFCDFRSRVDDCSTGDSTMRSFDCSNKPDGLYEGPSGPCTATYTECKQGLATLQQCTGGQVFDATVSACRKPDEVFVCKYRYAANTTTTQQHNCPSATCTGITVTSPISSVPQTVSTATTPISAETSSTPLTMETSTTQSASETSTTQSVSETSTMPSGTSTTQSVSETATTESTPETSTTQSVSETSTTQSVSETSTMSSETSTTQSVSETSTTQTVSETSTTQSTSETSTTQSVSETSTAPSGTSTTQSISETFTTASVPETSSATQSVSETSTQSASETSTTQSVSETSTTQSVSETSTTPSETSTTQSVSVTSTTESVPETSTTQSVSETSTQSTSETSTTLSVSETSTTQNVSETSTAPSETSTTQSVSETSTIPSETSTTQSVSETSTTESVPETSTTQSVSETSTQSTSGTSTTQSVSETSTTQSVPGTSTTQSASSTSTTESIPETTTQPVSETSTTQSVSETSSTQSVPGASTTQSVSETSTSASGSTSSTSTFPNVYPTQIMPSSSTASVTASTTTFTGGIPPQTTSTVSLSSSQFTSDSIPMTSSSAAMSSAMPYYGYMTMTMPSSAPTSGTSSSAMPYYSQGTMTMPSSAPTSGTSSSGMPYYGHNAMTMPFSASTSEISSPAMPYYNYVTMTESSSAPTSGVPSFTIPYYGSVIIQTSSTAPTVGSSVGTGLGDSKFAIMVQSDLPLNCLIVGDGVHADPETPCSRIFYYCSKGTGMRLECPDDMFYDAEGSTCSAFEQIPVCVQSVTRKAAISDVLGLLTSGMVCLGKPDGRYPNPLTTCSSLFILCTDGVASISACPAGLFFNSQGQTCEPRHLVPACTMETRKPSSRNMQFDCSSLSDGLYAVKSDSTARQYVLCYGGRKYRQECPEGMIFDDYLKLCHQIAYGKLLDSFVCADLPDGNYPNPEIPCSVSYYKCQDGQASFKMCPPLTVFNEATRVCDYLIRVKSCDQKQQEFVSGLEQKHKRKRMITDFCSPNMEGNYAHPGMKCSEFYYKCARGVIIPKICQHGTRFNQRNRQCDMPHNVDDCFPYKH